MARFHVVVDAEMPTQEEAIDVAARAEALGADVLVYAMPDEEETSE